MSTATQTIGNAKQKATIAPMLCTLVDEPFDNENWIFEPKYDGLRVLAYFDGRDVTLMSRNQASQNFQFPEIVEALRTSLKRSAIIDGEIVCFDEQGRSSFRKLQQRFHLENAAEVRERMKRYPASIFLFDVLSINGRDLTQTPLSERKEKLRSLVRWSDRVRWTDYTVGNGRERFRRRLPRSGGGNCWETPSQPLLAKSKRLVGEDQVHRPAGICHRRLHRSAAVARWPRSAARRLL